MHTAADHGPTIRMVPATLQDVDAVLQMLDEARWWLAEVGVAQWQAPFEREELVAAVEGRRVVLALDEDLNPIGSLHLSFEHDPAWADTQSNAAYVHRLVVARSAAGTVVGAAMLNWAALRSAERGALALRLYCAKDNDRLVRHYTNLGFREVGTSAVRRAIDGANVPVTLLERRSTELS